MIVEQEYDTDKYCTWDFSDNAGLQYNKTTAAYETYATANYAHYWIKATERGTASGIYEGAVPTVVAAGDFKARFRVGVEGAEAETDTIVATLRHYALDDIIDSMWDDDLETGVTVRQAMQRMAAVLAGKVSGAGTGDEVITGMDGITPRVRITVDSRGNRSAASYDP